MSVRRNPSVQSGKVFKHIEDVKVNVVFSDDGAFRYVLDIVRKGGTGKIICAIMQNPSVANVAIADKSVQFLEKLIFEKNVPAFKDVVRLIIVNQFAFIQTNDFLGTDGHIGIDNDAHLEWAINKADIILIAWGIRNNYVKRQDVINAMIQKYRKKYVYKGRTHPSRGCYDGFLIT